MTKRCRHEYESKTDYPNEIFCMKCSTGWNLADYIDYDDIKLKLLPKYIREKVIKNQKDTFALDLEKH